MPTNNNSGATKWTAQQDEVLTSLWREGKSATAIAVIMGGDLTRNSIIGRAHRLKLHETSPRKKAPRIAARRGDPQQHGNRGQVTAKGIVARTEARQRAASRAELQHRDNTPFRVGTLPPERDEGVDVSHLLGFADRRIGHQCAWVHGDPLEAGSGFCGKPVKPGTEWCPDHWARVYSGRAAQV